jgi:hypothetical protein
MERDDLRSVGGRLKIMLLIAIVIGAALAGCAPGDRIPHENERFFDRSVRRGQ